MTDSLADLLVSVLDFAPLARIRRNHGLEHATLHVLAERFPRKAFAGHSNMNGFWVLGDVSTSDLDAAVHEALQRLLRGEKKWAVHPNCGTNFVTSGVLAGGAASLAMLGGSRSKRDQLDRIALGMMLATLALIVSQPLGLILQARLTTSSQVETLELIEIIPTTRGKMKAHRVITVS